MRGGRFTLSTHWLESDRGNDRLISVTIRLQPPLTAGAIRAMDGWPLSPRHKELCLCLLRGMSYRETASAIDCRATPAVGANGRQ